jgi:hypothetical protein
MVAPLTTVLALEAPLLWLRITVASVKSADRISVKPPDAFKAHCGDTVPVTVSDEYVRVKVARGDWDTKLECESVWFVLRVTVRVGDSDDCVLVTFDEGDGDSERECEAVCGSPSVAVRVVDT